MAVALATPGGTSPTHDVDMDLRAVLERPLLAGECDAVAAGSVDVDTRLRCGKWMFFEKTFGTVGIPFSLLQFLQQNYASFYGGLRFRRRAAIAPSGGARASQV